MHFETIGDIEDVETLAVGGRILDIMRMQQHSLVPDDGASSRGGQGSSSKQKDMQCQGALV